MATKLNRKSNSKSNLATRSEGHVGSLEGSFLGALAGGELAALMALSDWLAEQGVDCRECHQEAGPLLMDMAVSWLVRAGRMPVQEAVRRCPWRDPAVTCALVKEELRRQTGVYWRVVHTPRFGCIQISPPRSRLLSEGWGLVMTAEDRRRLHAVLGLWARKDSSRLHVGDDHWNRRNLVLRSRGWRPWAGAGEGAAKGSDAGPPFGP